MDLITNPGMAGKERTMKTIELTNDFHNTAAHVRIGDGITRLSPRRVHSIRAQLCGIADCKCGGWLGERGRQSVAIEPQGDGTVNIWIED